MAIFLKFVCTIVVSSVFCGLLTKAIRDLAKRIGLAAGPAFSHHTHRAPIPRLGGISIFFTFISGCGAYALLATDKVPPQPVISGILRMLLPATFLFVVGLIDDLKGLSARAKLLMEVMGGVCLYFSGLRLASIHLGATWVDSLICLGATVFWVVLVCNAINLIDGLDGLAAGAALFSMVTIFTVAIVQGRSGVAIITTLLAGSVLGFLVFNFNPASIFLGDSGSLFIGFMLSALVLAESPKQQTLLDALFIPVTSLALPLTDTGLSVVRRFMNGHRLFGADREHVHHKLLELGLTFRQAVWVLYGFSAICSILSMVLLGYSDWVLIPVGALLLVIVFFGVWKLGYTEFAEFGRMLKSALHQRRNCARNIPLRKTISELSQAETVSEILTLVEGCLRHDFDAFEIILGDRFETLAPVYECNGLLQRHWNDSLPEKLVLDLALTGPECGHIGHLLLHHSIARELLIDTSLVKWDLASSVGLALERCFRPYLQAAAPEITVHADVRWVQ